MAISFRNIKKAYEVFNELKKSVLPELSISSFPEDMSEWTDRNQENPQANQVYGFSKKSDSGWESIVFFVENPSDELKEKFEELKTEVGNSSISGEFFKNSNLWIFGWL